MASEKLGSLQILRGIAASLVVYAHAAHFAHNLGLVGSAQSAYTVIGSAGVDIFFGISGAVIYLTAFAGRRLPMRLFVVKRLQRIVPIYFAISLIWAPIALLIGWTVTGWSVLASITFLPFDQTVLEPGWSLSYEMLFYAGAALLLAFPRALIPLIVAYCICWYFSSSSPFVSLLGSPLILEFAMGIAIAARWRTRKPIPAWVGIYAIALGLAGLVLPIALGAPDLTHAGRIGLARAVLWGIPAAMILSGSLSLEPHITIKRSRWAIFLGDASYSIYLVHWPVMAVLAFLISDKGLFPFGPLAGPILFAAGIAGGSATYVFAEAPLMRLLKDKRRLQPFIA